MEIVSYPNKDREDRGKIQAREGNASESADGMDIES